jgi:hypothetical protein
MRDFQINYFLKDKNTLLGATWITPKQRTLPPNVCFCSTQRRAVSPESPYRVYDVG